MTFPELLASQPPEVHDLIRLTRQATFAEAIQLCRNQAGPQPAANANPRAWIKWASASRCADFIKEAMHR